MSPKRTVAVPRRMAEAVILIGVMSGLAVADTANASMLPLDFVDLPGWAEDHHLEALAAFSNSCSGPPLAIRENWEDHRLAEESRGVETGGFEPRSELRAACASLEHDPPRSNAEARAFFETYFQPREVVPSDGQRKVTGYFEPLLPGAREKTDRFRFPIYAMPDGLVAITRASRPSGFPEYLQAALKTPSGLSEPPDRRAIEDGDHGLKLDPIVWLDDPIELYFVHIQGSARIALKDRSTMRISYAGKNGHLYASIGREIVKRGLMPLQDITAEGLKDWLRANPEIAADIFPVNPSYIFFREIEGLAEESGPIGAEGVPLTAGRTLAVDPRFHRYGWPVFVTSDLPTLPDGTLQAFRRLMIAQDTGSAIRGPVRGDIFTGTGPEAGVLAGMINHAARFFVLLPREDG